MLVPVYQYHSETPFWRYLYSTDPNVGNGWANDGVAFHAYQNEEPGTVPIYQYHADSPAWRYFYSSDANAGHGWTKDGVAFHAFQEEAPGAVSFYQYHAADPAWRYLYSSDPNVGLGWTKDGVGFYALAEPIEWHYRFDDIEYDESIRPVTEQDLISTRRFDNASPTSTLEQTVTISGKKSSTFEWGLEEKLSAGAKLGFEAGLPFEGVSGELSIQLDLGSHQTWSTTEEKEYSFTETVTVPPGGSAMLQGFVDWAENVVTPFTLTVRVAAKGGGADLTGGQVSQLFSQLNPGIRVLAVNSNEIIVSLRGQFSGSYAIDTFTKLEPLLGDSLMAA
jgi:hypothetical protein